MSLRSWKPTHAMTYIKGPKDAFKFFTVFSTTNVFSYNSLNDSVSKIRPSRHLCSWFEHEINQFPHHWTDFSSKYSISNSFYMYYISNKQGQQDSAGAWFCIYIPSGKGAGDCVDNGGAVGDSTGGRCSFAGDTAGCGLIGASAGKMLHKFVQFVLKKPICWLNLSYVTNIFRTTIAAHFQVPFFIRTRRCIVSTDH